MQCNACTSLISHLNTPARKHVLVTISPFQKQSVIQAAFFSLLAYLLYWLIDNGSIYLEFLVFQVEMQRDHGHYQENFQDISSHHLTCAECYCKNCLHVQQTQTTQTLIKHIRLLFKKNFYPFPFFKQNCLF